MVSACSGPPDCGKPDQADVDVAVEPDVHLVAQGRTLPAADRRLLEAVAGQALIALRNQQIADQAAEARRRADAIELRTALLSRRRPRPAHAADLDQGRGREPARR